MSSEFNFPRRNSLPVELMEKYIGDVVYVTRDIYRCEEYVLPWHLSPNEGINTQVSTGMGIDAARVDIWNSLKWQSVGALPDSALPATPYSMVERNFAAKFMRSHNIMIWNDTTTWCGALRADGTWVVEDVRSTDVNGTGIPKSLAEQRKLAKQLSYEMPEIIFEGKLSYDTIEALRESDTPIVVRTINARQDEGRWIQWLLGPTPDVDEGAVVPVSNTPMPPDLQATQEIPDDDYSKSYVFTRVQGQDQETATKGVDEDASGASGQPQAVVPGILP